MFKTGQHGGTLVYHLLQDLTAEIVETTLVVSWFRFVRVGSCISVLRVIILPGMQILNVRSRVVQIILTDNSSISETQVEWI